MSVYYSVYAEAKVDGKWYCICPTFTGKDGKVKTGEIYGAQSVFRGVDDELRDHIIFRGVPDDMSDGVRHFFKENLDEELEGWFNKMTYRQYYEQMLYCVNLASIAAKVNPDRPYKHEGYVLKREYDEFEVYEREEFSEWLTQAEYDALSAKEKRQYIFYRWNDPWGEYGIYETLVRRIRTLAVLFANTFEFDFNQHLWEGIPDSDVRVYVYQS